ncbi:MAG: hypothetical protein R3C68_10765 [Myxococcota bacterium]
MNCDFDDLTPFVFVAWVVLSFFGRILRAIRQRAKNRNANKANRSSRQQTTGPMGSRYTSSQTTETIPARRGQHKDRPKKQLSPTALQRIRTVMELLGVDLPDEFESQAHGGMPSRRRESTADTHVRSKATRTIAQPVKEVSERSARRARKALPSVDPTHDVQQHRLVRDALILNAIIEPRRSPRNKIPYR